MARVGTGLYRVAGGWSGPATARVRFPEGDEADITRPQYLMAGYKPAYDQLPTKAEYDASRARKG
jgi:hypothetical protein